MINVKMAFLCSTIQVVRLIMPTFVSPKKSS